MEDTGNSARKTYSSLKAFLWKTNTGLIAVLIVAGAGYFAVTYVTESDACSSSCRSTRILIRAEILQWTTQ